MLYAALFLAGAVATASPATDSTAALLYRVELTGGQSSWAIGKPQANGSLLLFKHYPDGAFMSVRVKDVQKIVAGVPPEVGKRLKPGEQIEVGATGGGGAGGTAAGGTASAGKALAIPPPGARKDGSALFNPDRSYKADWDSKLVPGSTMGYPNSLNDYAEGKTIAHPPAPASQSAPGDVPRAPEPNPQ